ncbi:hypothetical protein ACX9R5_01565 [Rathayibacter sp. CAU 1779]
MVHFPSEELVRFARILYPHPGLADGPYERAVAGVIDAATADPVLAQILWDGIRDGLLDAIQTGEPGMRAIEDTTFFQELRARTGWSLYDDHEVWDFIGYPGSSFELGGYLHRGFDDLDWLPDVRITEPDEEPAQPGSRASTDGTVAR